MTVRELIDRLEEMLEDGVCTDESNVLLMTQENWPFENEIDGLCTRIEAAEADREDDDDSDAGGADDVFICEGRQLGYGTKAAWQACR